jgi:hypothetical protein
MDVSWCYYTSIISQLVLSLATSYFQRTRRFPSLFSLFFSLITRIVNRLDSSSACDKTQCMTYNSLLRNERPPDMVKINRPPCRAFPKTTPPSHFMMLSWANQWDASNLVHCNTWSTLRSFHKTCRYGAITTIPAWV